MNSLSPKTAPDSANQTYRLPPKLFDARCAACWFMRASPTPSSPASKQKLAKRLKAARTAQQQ